MKLHGKEMLKAGTGKLLDLSSQPSCECEEKVPEDFIVHMNGKKMKQPSC